MSGHVAQTPISWGRRRSLLGSLWINRPGSKAEERFFERVGHWKELAQEFLIELYTLRRVRVTLVVPDVIIAAVHQALNRET